MSAWWRRYRGRLEVELALAVVVGAAAFLFAALVSAAARSHVPGALLGVVFLLAILAVARYAGILYAVPVGVVTLEAFDWYFLPPTRSLTRPAGAHMPMLGLFAVLSLLVGAVAVIAVRRLAASEGARGVLADEQAALRRVATLVARQPSFEEVFATVTDEAGRLFGIDVAQMLVDEGDGTARVVAAWSLRDAPVPVGARLSLDGEGVAARAFRTRGPAREDGAAAAVAAPIVVGGRVWGLIVAGSLRPERLPAGVELRFEAFADLVATAIANTEARIALEQVAAEQAALGRVATLVAEGASAADLFSAVVREVAQVLDLPVITLAKYESDATSAVILASVGDSGLAVGSRWPLDGPSLSAMVFATGRPARIDDYSGLPGAVAAARRDSSTGSTVGVPITVDGKVWGVVCVGSTGLEPLPADTEERLAGFTDLIATAIANAEAGTAIARLAEEQAALRRVATLVARGMQPGEVFAAVAEELAGVLEVEHAHVVRYEADATATIVASWGNESGSWGDDAVLWSVGSNWTLEGESVSARVFRTGLPARIDDYGRSTVGAAIVIDDRLWGAAITASAYASLPAAAEAQIATFTELIGIAISNAETRAELTASRARVVAAADETRRRIERDLHDGLQQRLVALALKVRAAETLSPRPSGVVQGELWQLADGLRDALDELREISHGIHPAILSKGGLGPALKALARRSDVPIVLDLQLDSRLEESLEVAAYYIASEAITNALKHAQASLIELHVDSRDGAVTLTIRDDGIGGADPRGSGIIGLIDRVEALGGTISVVSPPGEGTTLHVHLPADPGIGSTPPGAAPSAPRTAAA